MGTNLAKASQEYRKLLSFVLDQPHGARLDYAGVTAATGVKMDIAGKTKLRRAIVNSKREYSIERNIGYVLAHAEVAGAIADSRTQEVEGRVRKLHRSLMILSEAFYEELPEEEKQIFTIRLSVTGALTASMEQAKRLYSREPKRISQTTETIPLP